MLGIKTAPVLILIALIQGCLLNPPKTATEPACTRKTASRMEGDAIFLKDAGEYLLRYNKAMWANYNRYLPKELYTGKSGTILCFEKVPGPNDFMQDVVAVQVDGIENPVFMEWSDAMHFAQKSRGLNKSLEAEKILDTFVGTTAWSTPKNLSRSPTDRLTFFNNLERVTVIKVVADDYTPPTSFQVYFERENGDLNYQVFTTTAPEAAFRHNWHLEDPYTKYTGIDDAAWILIRAEKIVLGMTQAMVMLARGFPDSTNTTESTYGTTEQWVYERNHIPDYYLYFENSVLTTIQE